MLRSFRSMQQVLHARGGHSCSATMPLSCSANMKMNNNYMCTKFSSAATPPLLQVLVPIADGSEEIETACITDTLTRAGANVTVASVMGRYAMQQDHMVVAVYRGLTNGLVDADTVLLQPSLLEAALTSTSRCHGPFVPLGKHISKQKHSNSTSTTHVEE